MSGTQTKEYWNDAAERGDLKTIKRLHKNHPEGCTIFVMNGAAANGHLDVVKFLIDEKIVTWCTVVAMDRAAGNGHLDVVKFLHTTLGERSNCSTNAMDWASQNGHLHVVKWLFENRSERCTWIARTFSKKNGHIDVLQFLEAIRLG